MNETPSARMLSLDVIRGIALCGIAFVNFQQQWLLYPGPDGDKGAFWALELLAHQRFFSAFTFLFGIGFALIVDGARRRGMMAQSVMWRRLLPLFLLGLVHQILHPGEALLYYSAFGFVFLYPLTFVSDLKLRRTLATVGGIALTLLGAPFGGIVLIPGLLLLGFAFAMWGLPQALDENPKPAAMALLVLVPLTLGMSYLQYRSLGTVAYSHVAAVTGLIYTAMWMALVYVLLRTPLRSALGAMFASLGRTALTNYILATLVIIGSGLLLGYPREDAGATNEDFYTAFAVAAVMLVIQAVLSWLWLRRFGQGPLEKGWRYLTWEAFGGPMKLQQAETAHPDA